MVFALRVEMLPSLRRNENILSPSQLDSTLSSSEAFIKVYPIMRRRLSDAGPAVRRHARGEQHGSERQRLKVAHLLVSPFKSYGVVKVLRMMSGMSDDV